MISGGLIFDWFISNVLRIRILRTFESSKVKYYGEHLELIKLFWEKSLDIFFCTKYNNIAESVYGAPVKIKSAPRMLKSWHHRSDAVIPKGV